METHTGIQNVFFFLNSEKMYLFERRESKKLGKDGNLWDPWRVEKDFVLNSFDASMTRVPLLPKMLFYLDRKVFGRMRLDGAHLPKKCQEWRNELSKRKALWTLRVLATTVKTTVSIWSTRRRYHSSSRLV